MKLVVDASVAVKWFIAEQWTEESRMLLASRIDRHAPDLILAETTNVLWKKARRGDIKDPQAYFAEAANLPDVLVLHRCQDLFVRASAIALDIDHPVYDCIYLACAEAEGVPLVTADHRLKDVSRAGPAIDVWHIGDEDVRQRISAAATELGSG